MGSQSLKTNAEDHRLEMLEQGRDNEWAISVFSAPGMTADQIAIASPIRHPQIRVSTVVAIRALGHDVTSSGYGFHADLKLVDKPNESTWEALSGVFDEPRRNPRLEEV